MLVSPEIVDWRFDVILETIKGHRPQTAAFDLKSCLADC
jgi:hypothetical protein